MKHIGWISFIVTLLLFSCGSLNNIDISYDDDMVLKSIRGSKATFVVPTKVDNPTSYALKLKKIEFDIFRRGYTFAELSLPSKIKISAHSNQPHTLQLQIYFKDPFALISDDFDIESKEYTFTGFIKIGAGLFSKKLKFENVTFEQLINQLEQL